MSQLVQMRQRIKAIETIKKITSAMRLISRSFHTRMQKKEVFLSEYKDLLCIIFSEIRTLNSQWKPAKFFPSEKLPRKELLIIVGGQKGLCGNFNANLFYWIDNHLSEINTPATHIIVLGKRLEEHCKKRSLALKERMEELKLQNLEEITEKLLHLMFKTNEHYTKVSIISNQPKTFFSHEQKTHQLIPFGGCFKEDETAPQQKIADDYVPEHSPDLVLNILAQNHLKLTVRTALFESLLGEQAARFISMDNATRNANTFLESMQLQYNKARQAKITKELTELAGAFEVDSLT